MRRSLTISPLFSFRQQLLKLYFSHLCHLRHKLRLRRCWHCKYPKFRCFYMVLSKHFLHWALFHFNPLPPCGGRHLSEPTSQKQGHFNPLPPCGGRPVIRCITEPKSADFNPLPPCGGRRPAFRPEAPSFQFQSTPSVWRETAKESTLTTTPSVISIHSLRVEGDQKTRFLCV